MSLKRTVISLSLCSLLASTTGFAQPDSDTYPVHKRHLHPYKRTHVVNRNHYVCRPTHHVYRHPHHTYRPTHRVYEPVRVYRPRPVVVRPCPVPPRVVYKNVYVPVPAPAPCRTVLWDGWYFGGAGGYDMYSARQNLNYSDVILSINQNPAIRTNGFLGELFLGYGRDFRHLYLGAEVFGNLSSANGGYRSNLSSAVFYNTKTEVRGSYGASVLPGFRPTDTTLLYARLGYTETKFKVNETMNDFNNLTFSSTSRSKWKGGFTWGGGIETVLIPHLSTRLEYTHTNYGTFSNHLLRNNVLGSANQFTFADNQVMLGLIYHI